MKGGEENEEEKNEGKGRDERWERRRSGGRGRVENGEWTLNSEGSQIGQYRIVLSQAHTPFDDSPLIKLVV